MELVEGTDNVFRDLGDPDPDLKQTKAVLAADIISALDGSGFTVRKAGKVTGFAAADFSRVRNANLARFTIDRLMRMRTALHRATGLAVPPHMPVPQLQRLSHTLNATSPTPVIVDKSYVQSASSLLDLEGDWHLLFPDAFFFEVASTDLSARESCLAKLCEVHRHGGVHVAPNVGELLHREIHDLNRAGPPSENLIQGLDIDSFFTRFDDLYEARREAVIRAEVEFDEDIDGLIARANKFHGRIEGAFGGTTEQRKEAYRMARQTVAQDRNFIAAFFADFVCRGTHALPGAPMLAAIARTSAFGPDWTIYRWLQVQLLYALDLLERHGRLDPETLTEKQREKLQHEVIDMGYVVLGVLQGALASKDRKMRAMFEQLRPDGALLPPS